MKLLLRAGGYYEVVGKETQLKVTILPTTCSYVFVYTDSALLLHLSIQKVMLQKACQGQVPPPSKKMSLV